MDQGQELNPKFLHHDTDHRITQSEMLCYAFLGMSLTIHFIYGLIVSGFIHAWIKIALERFFLDSLWLFVLSIDLDLLLALSLKLGDFLLAQRLREETCNVAMS